MRQRSERRGARAGDAGPLGFGDGVGQRLGLLGQLGLGGDGVGDEHAPPPSAQRAASHRGNGGGVVDPVEDRRPLDRE